ncbi:MAG TPA: proline dehydrogenase family protein [Flavipsychrobacter sp.]|nr:proline dehydrogenase family protein [Flavipsychrobacter sp.]
MLPEFDNTEVAFKYKTNRDLKQAQFLFSSMGSPTLTGLGIWFTKWAMKIGLPINGIIKSTIFKQFCGGETMQEAAQTANMLAQYNVGVIMDYGVEGKEDEHEFDKAVPEFIKAIEYASTNKSIPFISVKITGFARFQLMERVHNKVQLSDNEQAEWNRVANRIERICAAAYENNVMVLVDAEETWIQEAVNELVDAMMEKYNKEHAVIFNTFQLYCHGTLAYLQEAYKIAESKNYKLGAKLVRGAYMEKERKRATEKGYPSPIQPNKSATDKDYDEAVIFCLDRLNNLSLFIGTHNEKSCLLAAKYMKEKGIKRDDKRVYFSQLFGMSDNISLNLGYAGYNVAKYLPYGPVKDVIPYLMRRAQENTSVAGQTGRELSLINTELKRRRD